MPKFNEPSPPPERADNIHLCPDGNTPMLMQTLHWDGATQDQMYRCPECGKVETVSKDLDPDI